MWAVCIGNKLDLSGDIKDLIFPGIIMTTYKVVTHEAFAPLDHADLTEKTYRLLREKILRRQLKAGEKISVDEAAEGLGISRTPVLHALERLANDGLVKIIPRKGTFVSELTKQDVKELFDIRVLIETYAASIVLQVIVIYWPPAQNVFNTATLTSTDWLLILLVASSIIVVDEILKAFGVHRTPVERGRQS